MAKNGYLLELPVLPSTNTSDERCRACAHCCTYVAVPIDSPDDRDTVSSIIWYLYHENIRVYQDPDRDWYVQFWTRCEALRPDGMCGVYEVRPDVCEEFTPDDCEVTNNDYGERVGFDTAHEFVEYIKRERPRLYRFALGNTRRRSLTGAPKQQRAVKNEPLKLTRNGTANGTSKTRNKRRTTSKRH